MESEKEDNRSNEKGSPYRPSYLAADGLPVRAVLHQVVRVSPSSSGEPPCDGADALVIIEKPLDALLHSFLERCEVERLTTRRVHEFKQLSIRRRLPVLAVGLGRVKLRQRERASQTSYAHFALNELKRTSSPPEYPMCLAIAVATSLIEISSSSPTLRMTGSISSSKSKGGA